MVRSFHKNQRLNANLKIHRTQKAGPVIKLLAGKNSMMSKNIPTELRDHILPFNWDVTKVWSLDVKVVDVLISKFEYLLNLPLWSSVGGKGMLFDLKPMSVISNPSISPYQAERLSITDTTYPIDFLIFNDRPWILDGVHRLAKLYSRGEAKVRTRFHPESSLPMIIVDQPTCSGNSKGHDAPDTQPWASPWLPQTP
jgi:hypothetical protein